MKGTLWLYLLFPAFIAFGQGEGMTTEKGPSPQELYQSWLETSGLGQVFAVHTVVEDSKISTLYLQFHTEDLDSLSNAWHTLKANFDSTHTISLEQQLFYQWSYFMDRPQEELWVEIYDSYDVEKVPDPQFYVILFFQDGGLQIDANTKQKTEPREIRLELKPVKLRTASKGSWKNTDHKTEVFEKVLEHMRSYYETSKCANRNPKLKVLESDVVLRFEIEDLCREVLEDAEQPFPCRIAQLLGKDCNWITREKIYFLIAYSQEGTHAVLKIIMDGKYATGYGNRPQDGGYNPMDGRFDQYFKDYADVVTERLTRVLKSKAP